MKPPISYLFLLISSSFFLAEWQTSHEQLSFQHCQIGGRIFTETKLSSAGFPTLLQVRPQVAPPLIIAGAKLLGREALLLSNHGSYDAHRPPYHHPRNSTASARRAPLMNACDSKAVFQVVIGAR